MLPKVKNILKEFKELRYAYNKYEEVHRKLREERRKALKVKKDEEESINKEERERKKKEKAEANKLEKEQKELRKKERDALAELRRNEEAVKKAKREEILRAKAEQRQKLLENETESQRKKREVKEERDKRRREADKEKRKAAKLLGSGANRGSGGGVKKRQRKKKDATTTPPPPPGGVPQSTSDAIVGIAVTIGQLAAGIPAQKDEESKISLEVMREMEKRLFGLVKEASDHGVTATAAGVPLESLVTKIVSGGVPVEPGAMAAGTKIITIEEPTPPPIIKVATPPPPPLVPIKRSSSSSSTTKPGIVATSTPPRPSSQPPSSSSPPHSPLASSSRSSASKKKSSGSSAASKELTSSSSSSSGIQSILAARPTSPIYERVFYTYQLSAVKQFLSRPARSGLLVSFGTGTGKTFCSVAAGISILEQARDPAYLASPDADIPPFSQMGVLIVTLNSVRDAYIKEIRRLSSIRVKEGALPRYISQDIKSKFQVTHHASNHWLHSGVHPRKFGFQPPITSWNDIVLIIDEAHILRNAAAGHGGQRGNTIVSKIQKAYKTMLLTATPVYNANMDFISLLNLILPKKPNGDLVDPKSKLIVNPPEDLALMAKFSGNPKLGGDPQFVLDFNSTVNKYAITYDPKDVAETGGKAGNKAVPGFPEWKYESVTLQLLPQQVQELIRIRSKELPKGISDAQLIGTEKESGAEMVKRHDAFYSQSRIVNDWPKYMFKAASPVAPKVVAIIERIQAIIKKDKESGIESGSKHAIHTQFVHREIPITTAAVAAGGRKGKGKAKGKRENLRSRKDVGDDDVGAGVGGDDVGDILEEMVAVSKEDQENEAGWLAYISRHITEALGKDNVFIVTVHGGTKNPEAVINDFNAMGYTGKTKILIFTRAASTGVDYKGLRSLHIMEPDYSESYIEQVKGRAVRLQSHDKDLVPYQFVNIYLYKMGEYLDESGKPQKSSDLLIHAIMQKRAMITGPFREKINKQARIRG